MGGMHGEIRGKTKLEGLEKISANDCSRLQSVRALSGYGGKQKRCLQKHVPRHNTGAPAYSLWCSMSQNSEFKDQRPQTTAHPR